MKLLKKIYDKDQLVFAITWIVAYVILMSFGDIISATIGINKIVTVFIGLLLSLTLIFFFKRNNLLKTYGLCKSDIHPKQMLYYIPAIIIVTVNLWFDLTLNYTPIETIIYIITMVCVGFLEEIIFRGLLFNTMKKDNLKIAIFVSSLTFGVGHIVNLFNGSTSQLLPNILQVIYATSAGFMFVMIYCRSNSLIVCILIHAIFNSLSAFSVNYDSVGLEIIVAIILTIIAGGYALYLSKIKTPENNL